MANRALSNGNVQQTKLTRCSSNVADSVADKSKVGWTSPRDIWRNLSLRRKAEVNKIQSVTFEVRGFIWLYLSIYDVTMPRCL